MHPGSQVRPVVHVMDVVRAMMQVMQGDENILNGEIFNVGSNDQNYKIYEIG